MKVLVTGNDDLITRWTFDTFGVHCLHVNLAVGIMEGNQLIGSCFFQCHSGADVELSYYGPSTLSLDVVKGLAKIAVDHLGVSRITSRTSRSNKMLTRGIHKIGFVYEGICHSHYGENDDAVVYGLFGRNLAKLAGRVMQ